MSDKGRLGLTILGVASLFGVAADALLREGPWGLNLLLWMSLLIASLLLLSPRRREMIAGGGGWLFVPLAAFSCAFIWRDSLVLKGLSLVAILVTLALLMLRAQGLRPQVSGVAAYLVGGALAGLNVVVGALQVIFVYLPWGEFLQPRASRRPWALARGLALALPLLLLFGGLLVAGDAVFAAMVQRVLLPDFSVVLNVFSHCAVAALFGWMVAGYLRGVLIGDEWGRIARQKAPAPRLGATEIAVVLGSLDALFLLFVIVQIRYLFGGASLVGIKSGLTYAEYARQGFFELVAVAALALPVLLGAHWLLRRETPADERGFRLPALIQVLLIFVIMASAIERMVLYQREYGQTELRLYTSAFMGWLGVVFLWFLLTVLRGRRRHFVFGSMLAGFGVLAVLYAINPDAVIARVNLARAAGGRPFDASYAASLSADAVPALAAGLASLSANDRSSLTRQLAHHWRPDGGSDWRTWSVSRARAYRAMRQGPGNATLAGRRGGRGF
jgi:Domain of unknown function (DUF4173)